MTGRGIDQVLPHPADPRLYEAYAKSANRLCDACRAKGMDLLRVLFRSNTFGVTRSTSWSAADPTRE